MKSKFFLYTVLYGAITGGIVAPASAIVIQNNSWTNTPGGKWEDGTKWSLGVPPALGQAAIFVTNAVSKTVTIDATTSGSFATNMTINDLTIGAPAGSVNTLLFQNPGTLTPFNVLDSATLTSGGVLTMDNAVVNIANQLRNFATLTVAGGSLNVSGDFNSQGVSNAVWVTGGQLAATGGNSFIGRVTVSNGTFLAHELFIGNPGQVGAGTLTVAGGLVALPVSFNGMVIGSNGGTGAVWQTGGQIITTNTDISIGGLFSPALGQMTVSNGTLLARNVFVGGQGDGVGTLTVAGGTVSADLLVATSSAATIEFPAGIITLSGALITNDLDFIVGGPGQTATLKLVGGTNNFISEIHLGSQAGATGMLWMTGGLLIAGDNLSVADAGVGQMTISNGTLRAAFRLDVATSAGSQGTLTVAGGTNILGSFLELATSIGATGTLWMTGGQLIVTNSDGTEIGLAGVGNMTVSNGIWQSSSVIVSHLAGSAGTLKIAGGTNLFTSFFEIADDPSVTGTVWMTGGQLIVTNRETLIGNSGVGRMTVSNGTWQARDVFVGDNAGSQGTLTIAGGTNTLSLFLSVGSALNSTGTMWMTGGQLIVTNQSIIVTEFGTGRVTISNGTVTARNIIFGDNSNARGTMTVAGGTITILQDLNVGFGGTQTLWQTGGQLTVTNGTTSIGAFDAGFIIVSNGTWRARDVALGAMPGSGGTLTIAGGTNTFFSLSAGADPEVTGTVWVTGGQLEVSGNGAFIGGVGIGHLTVSNGVFRTTTLLVTDSAGARGTFVVAGGTSTVFSTLGVGLFNCGSTGIVTVSGGSLFVTNAAGNALLQINSGTLTISGGLLKADKIVITNACAHFARTGGSLQYTTSVLNPNDDTDGDGFTNQQEIDAGTDPLDPSSFPSPVTSWKNGTGKWEVSTNWSAGVPSALFQAVLVTNATTKIVTIDATTSSSFPGTMTISNLTVSGPAGTVNTLQITNVGLATPFTILNSFTNSSGGNVVVTNSLLQVQGVSGDVFVNNGTFTILGGGVVSNATVMSVGSSANTTGSVWMTGSSAVLAITNDDLIIGSSGVGQMTVSNGSVQSVVVSVGLNDGSQGTLTMAGGTTALSSFLDIGGSANATGSVWVTGGRLVVTNNITFIGFLGVGQMTMSNGTMLAQDMTVGLSAGGQGRLTLAGGTNTLSSSLTVGKNVNATGSVWITGSTAQLVVTNGNMFIGNSSVGQMTVSNGTVLAQGVIVGANPGSQGTLSVAGGTNRLSSFLVIGESANSTGAMWVTSGQFVVTNSSTLIGDLGVGQMTVSNGTVLSEDMSVGTIAGSQGTLTTAGGTNRISSILALGNNANATGTVWMTGGQLVVTNDSTIIGVAGVGRMTVSNGIVRAQDVTVGADAGSQGMLTLAGGTVTATNLIVGVSDCTATGIVAVSGGSLFVTNAAGNATLEVQSGTLTISGGLLHADKIVITNACAHFTRTGGTLIYGTAILNPAGDTDGDGFSNQAELNAGSDPLDPTSVPPGQLSVAPATLSFSTIATGLTAQASFIVSNSAVGLLSGSATVTGGPFAIVSGSPFSLSAHGSTNVVVQFAPVSTGAFTNKVVFNAGAGGTSSNAVTGTGAAVPVANFTTTPTNGVVPLTVTFTNTSTGTITNDVWSFGDTTTSNTTATILTHTYNAAGSYGVTLVALGPVGVSTNTKPNLIHALNPPHLVVAPSSRDYGTVTVGLTNTLPFSVINTGDLVLTGTVATVSPFAISGASSYTVQPGQTGTVQVSFIPTSLGAFSNNVVFSSNGGVSTNSVVGTGASVGHIVVSPAALDFGTIATGTMSQRVFVVSNSGGTAVTNGTVTVSAPFAILSGQQFSVPALGSTNVVVEFAPSGAGAFTNPVVFATANGGSSTNQVTGTGAIAPAAGFTAAPTNGVAPLLVNFTDASSGVITNRLWSFGDSGTSTLASPSHTYSNAGVYSVSLTVIGPVGSSTTNRLNLITVTNVVPVAGFTASPTNGAAPLLVSFSDSSTGTITNRLWTFGDGATSMASLVMHTYLTAGVYSVSLTVFGPGGSDTLNQPGLITVTNIPPTAGFAASPTNGVAPLLVNFTDGSTGTITNRLWDFGDGGSSTVTSPSHTYTNAGNFSVTLTVFGPTGTDALTQPDLIVVTSGPTNADLEVIKFGSPNPVFVASNLTYTITVTNHGPATATSITLTDALPTSVTFSSASDECTNTGGIVVCDLGSLNAGEATNVMLVVVPTVAGKLTNTASVAATETDPVPANNTVTNTVTVTLPPLGTNDLAVVKLKAPKKIALSATTTNKVGKFSVTIQNRGPLTETIPDLTALSNLVTVSVQSLGTNCPSFSATLVPPKASFPINIAPNKKLTLIFTAIFDCANDPLASTKTVSHVDYRTTASVDLGAIDEVDTATSNDLCPRPPNPAIGDPGCGNKDPVTKQPGADVLTDVVVKQ